MKQTKLALAVLLLFAASAVADDAKGKATTMNVAQEMKLGDLSVTMEGKQSFMPPDKFRFEGTATYVAMGMKTQVTAVSDGAIVKQFVVTPMGAQASIVDLQKVRQKIPGYTPSADYNPLKYKEMLASVPDKKRLPDAVVDGVKVEGYELPAKDINLPLPSSGMLAVAKPEKLRVWVNPKDGLARKMEIEDAKGNVMLKMVFTNVKTGVDLPAATFQYEFPKGVQPMDMTDMLLGKPAGAPAPTP